MHKSIKFAAISLLALFVPLLIHCGFRPIDFSTMKSINRLPKIDPDYTQITLPPNIAPLNFKILEKGQQYQVRLSGNAGQPLILASKDGLTAIPIKPWKKLLEANQGSCMRMDIAVQSSSGQWQRCQTCSLLVSNDPIDEFIAYRLMNPLYIKWQHLGIYQRNLTNFNQTSILHNRGLDKACLNCHAFANQKTEQMSIHMRLGPGTSMLLASGDSLKRIDTTTPFNSASAAYTAWHPSEQILAFSVNKVAQFFHAKGYPLDVWDTSSDLLLYDVRNNQVHTHPRIASRTEMETYPNWSPDGKTLYFCSAPLNKAHQDLNTQSYKQIKYSLKRIPFDIGNLSWGHSETLINANETGLSVTHPKMSPDGRFIVFCQSNYGNFSIYQPSSDLYIMNTKTCDFKELNVNSDQSDSYHTWSSNSRWLVFSSKRRDNGLCTHLFLCHIDSSGQASKPFILPQKDPDFYNQTLITFNVPELIVEPVRVSPVQWKTMAWNPQRFQKAQLDPKVKVDAASGASPEGVVSY